MQKVREVTLTRGEVFGETLVAKATATKRINGFKKSCAYVVTEHEDRVECVMPGAINLTYIYYLERGK